MKRIAILLAVVVASLAFAADVEARGCRGGRGLFARLRGHCGGNSMASSGGSCAGGSCSVR